jgi:hypothetical protein
MTVYNYSAHRHRASVSGLRFNPRGLGAALYLLVLASAGALVIQVDPVVGSLGMMCGVCLFAAWGLPVMGRTVLCIGGLLILKIIYFHYLDPLSGPDEIRYHRQVVSYSSYIDFLRDYRDIVEKWGFSSSAVPALSVVIMPFYLAFNTTSPMFIMALNTLFHILNSILFYYLLSRYLIDKNKSQIDLSSICVSLVILSPVMVFYSSTFAKDTVALSVCLFVVVLLLRGRFILAAPLVLYATLLRPYSISVIFVYYALFSIRPRLMFMGMVGSMFLLVYIIGFDIKLYINSAIMIIFTFVSPNPASSGNWSVFHLATLSVESIAMGLVVVLSTYVFIRYKEMRPLVAAIAFGIVIYSIVLVAVGYTNIINRGEIYRIGYIGDNMVRKKLLVMPLVYLLASIALLGLRPRMINAIVFRSSSVPVSSRLARFFR